MTVRSRQKFSENLKGVIPQHPDFQHKTDWGLYQKDLGVGLLSSGVNPTMIHRKSKDLYENCVDSTS